MQLNGTVSFATGNLLQGVDVSSRDWFQHAKTGLFIGVSDVPFQSNLIILHDEKISVDLQSDDF